MCGDESAKDTHFVFCPVGWPKLAKEWRLDNGEKLQIILLRRIKFQVIRNI
jgi:hypothetical protein